MDEILIFNYALSASEIAALTVNQLPPPTTPTSISTVSTGGGLALSWPAPYVGWRLESNALNLSAGSGWFTVPGSSATNQVLIPLPAPATNVFFRLVYP